MPERRVVNTSVVSLFLKARPTPDATRYEPHLDGFDLILSFMTIAELHRWATVRHWGTMRSVRMERYLAHAYTVRHSDVALCRRWAVLIGDLQGRGRIISEADAWIAATALVLGVPLVSHNRRDFAGIPSLTLISEAP